MAKGHEQKPFPGECKTEKLHSVVCKATAEAGLDVCVAVCELLPAEAPCGYSIGASSNEFTPPPASPRSGTHGRHHRMQRGS